MRVERYTYSPPETTALAARLAASLKPGDVLALHGELGAGKTCFVRGLAQGLGIDPHLVSSPTFVLMQEYEAVSGRALIHVDAYRIGSEQDLATIGLDEMLGDSDTVIAIEWPERIPCELPKDRVIDITLEHRGDDRRRLEFNGPDSRINSVSPRTRPCSACATPVAIDRPTAPFCSDRCRLVDLGDWFDERHRISRPIEATDEESLD